MNTSHRVVFDCNVFLQALASPNGPAGRCVALALAGRVILYVSPQVIDEIMKVAARPKLVAKFKFRSERVTALIDSLNMAAVFVSDVPELFQYQRDPDDAHYVNLALAVDARLIVSRDKDLLSLTDDSTPASRQFRLQHPAFEVLTLPAFLDLVEPSIHG